MILPADVTSGSLLTVFGNMADSDDNSFFFSSKGIAANFLHL